MYYIAVASGNSRVVVPAHNYLRLRIMYEYADALTVCYSARKNT